ncbi:MAG TPA: hypothetical protein VKU00_16565, partial [Chthonomonadaceae bacterium]|nr:hypothetical protein [Chthonomonadaceae bacterium]
MRNCTLPFVEIMDYFEGRSASTQEARVQQHLESGCDRCRQRLTWLQQFLPAIHQAFTQTAASAPETALARARQIARERRPTPTRPSLRERIAQLLFDSRHPLSPAAVRGSANPETQQLYDADTYFVEIWLERVKEGVYYLICQTVGKGGSAPVPPESVALIAQDGARMQARQEGNEFHIAAVNPGVYQMRLRL